MANLRAFSFGDWMTSRRVALLALTGLVGLSVGCGQDDPDDLGPGQQPPGEQPYHPLVDGSWWEYAHSDWVERVELTTTDVGGQTAYLMVDSPNPNDDLRSDSIISSIDGRIARMTKEEYLVGAGGSETLTSLVSYGVGFTRFNEDWATRAVGYTETPEYLRVETPPGGTPRAPEERRHTFEIMSLSEEVVTGTGTFDCIVIKRTKDWQAEEDGVDASDAQTKTFWFARGIGKVQEKNEETGNTEVLIGYSIPGGGG
jgi:hypothetical protein